MPTIDEYNEGLDEIQRPIAAKLAAMLDAGLYGAEGKVYHGHPVWLVDGQPVAGYKAFPRWVTLMFWRGQEFQSRGALEPMGSSAMAGIKLAERAELNALPVDEWLREASGLGGRSR